MEAIVDRIEGDIAVLEIDGNRYQDVKLAQLPPDTRQGDVLAGVDGSTPAQWVRDDARRDERLAQNQALMDDLFEE